MSMMEFEDSEGFHHLISEENMLMTPPRESDSGKCWKCMVITGANLVNVERYLFIYIYMSTLYTIETYINKYLSSFKILAEELLLV